MEPHYGKPEDHHNYKFNWSSSVDDLFLLAREYADKYHSESLARYRTLKFDELTKDKFWPEYVWCVYVSGFKASIITGKIDALLAAYHYMTSDPELVWERVKPILGNRRKFNAIIETQDLMSYLGWPQFKGEFLQSPDDIKRLPFIGKITCHHLARNIGLDTVKEDLHLVRLANHFKFDSATLMCEYLKNRYSERLGVVDFILWSYCAAMGTGAIS